MNFFSRMTVFMSMIVFWLVIIFGFLFLPYVTPLFYQQRSISLLILPMIMDTKVLVEFEKKHGVKVYVNYYESSSELYSKMRATGGKGYDLIVPPDYLTEQLINDGTIKRLDPDKLNFFNNLQPHFLGHYFDPNNEYSIPYFIGIMGLGINKDYFGGKMPTPSWSLIFETPKQPYSICMTDIPREAVMLAGFYLYEDIDSLAQDDRLAVIKKLLQRQKEWVEVYSDARVEELLVSGSCPVAVGVSPDIFKSMRENKAIEFAVPREGTFITINSFVMPQTTTKEELAYELLNYLYQPEILSVSSKQYGFCPPIKNVPNHTHGVFCPDAKQLGSMEFFRNVLSPDEIQELWVSVLAH